jgi:hypothetical protein
MNVHEPFPRLFDMAELLICHRCGEAFDLPNLEPISCYAENVNPAITL